MELALGQQGLHSQQAKKKFRAPDYLESPDQELRKLTQQAYQKVRDSRLLGTHLDLENVRSASFQNLLRGITRLASELLMLGAS